MQATRPVFLFAFFCFFESLFAQNVPPPIVWQTGDERRDIRRETLFFEDSTMRMTAEEVLRQPMRAFPIERDWMKMRFEVAQKRQWLLFEIDNSQGRDSLRLVFSSGKMARTCLFRIQKNDALELVDEGGWCQKKADQKRLFNALRVDLAAGEKAAFLSSFESGLKLYEAPRAELFRPEAFVGFCQNRISKSLPVLLFYAGIIGALSLLGVFAFFQFIRTRDRAFLMYAGFEWSLAIYYFRVLWLEAELFGSPISPDLFFGSPGYLWATSSIFYALFLRDFLQNPKLKKSMNWMAAVSVVLFIVNFWALFNYNSWPKTGFFFYSTVVFWVCFVAVASTIQLLQISGTLRNYALAGLGCLLITTFLGLGLSGVEANRQIEMPFFAGGWFYSRIGSVLESLCFALGLGEKSRLLALEKHRAEQKLSGLRTVVAQDLHDELGSEISSFSLSAFAAARSGDPKKMAETLEKMAAQSSKMVDEMRDIVWALSPENDSIEQLEGRMRAFSALLFEDQNARLHFDFSENLTAFKMEAEARKQVYLFFKEAMANAARHGSPTNVFVKIRLGNEQLLLEIRDDGSGFDQNELKKSLGGNGLGNLQKRADMLGGRLEIESKKGAGATVRLVV